MTEAPKIDPNNTFINVAGAIIAVMVVSLLWFIAYALIAWQIPEANQTTLAQLVGMIGTQVGVVIGWYYGSSSAAKEARSIIATQANTAAKLADTAGKTTGGDTQ